MVVFRFTLVGCCARSMAHAAKISTDIRLSYITRVARRLEVSVGYERLGLIAASLITL
jgi:hypothetical protein